MRADPRLGLIHRRDKLPDCALALLQQLEDVKAGWITQDAEEAGGGGAVCLYRRENGGIHIWKAGYHRLMMKITIQYFDGCPHWRLADERVRNVVRRLSRDDVKLDYELIDSPETAERVGFRGSPTILIDGRDPFGTGDEAVGLSCRAQGAPSEDQIADALGGA